MTIHLDRMIENHNQLVEEIARLGLTTEDQLGIRCIKALLQVEPETVKQLFRVDVNNLAQTLTLIHRLRGALTGSTEKLYLVECSDLTFEIKIHRPICADKLSDSDVCTILSIVDQGHKYYKNNLGAINASYKFDNGSSPAMSEWLWMQESARQQLARLKEAKIASWLKQT